MKAETIHIIGLIGLRALAEIDLLEFRRCTDCSKFELEHKIEKYLELNEDKEAHMLYSELKKSEAVAESQEQLSYLLKQIYMISLQKAQHLSLLYAKTSDEPMVLKERQNIDLGKNHNKRMSPISEHDNFIKLAVMLLLKDLKGYTPIFEYRWKNEEIDCLLEPNVNNFPFVIIEGKTAIRDSKSLKNAISHLNKYISFWGKNSMGILITQEYNTFNNNFQPNDKSNSNIYIFEFDSENNKIYGQDYIRFKEEFFSKYLF